MRESLRVLLRRRLLILGKQEGFKDEISFVSPERNEAMAISFWDKQKDAGSYSHVAYLDVLKVLSKVVEAMPIMNTFEVGNSTSHRIAASV